MDFNDDAHIDVCQNIEAGLKKQYELNPQLTDALCIFALDSAKIAIKQHYGFAKNEKVTTHPLAQGIIEWCAAVGVERIGKINDLTLAEYLKRVEKIKRSVVLHSKYGSRGYYEFIKDFM